MAAVAAQVADHEKKLNKVMPAVFGVDDCPGTGLVDRVEKVESTQETIKEYIADQKAMNKYLLIMVGLMGTAIVGALIKLLFGA